MVFWLNKQILIVFHWFFSIRHWLTFCVLLVKDPNEIRSLAVSINIKVSYREMEISCIFWKHFYIFWNFLLLLTEGDSTLKFTLQITFQGLITYKQFSRKKVYVNKCVYKKKENYRSVSLSRLMFKVFEQIISYKLITIQRCI